MSNTLWDANGQCTFADDVSPTDAQFRDTLQFGSYPIGSVIAWAKSFTGVPSIPTGWTECDGSTISDSESPIDGVTIPNLNSGTQRFLRGSTTSGSTGGTETHNHAQLGAGSTHNYDTSGDILDSANHLPPYYEIVWVMRYK